VKLVFCDIDGVLNSRVFLAGLRPPPGLVADGPEWWAEMLDREAVGRLNRLLAETGASVVVSSSWRLGSTAEALQTILDLGGFEGAVVGVTPHLSEQPRGEEIQRYLASHPAEAFVILDDEDDMGELLSSLVRTSFDTGLLDEHVERAKKALGGPGA